MHGPLTIAALTIHRIAIPMKLKFRHAAADRAESEPLILEIELANGVTGFGETHPRRYVTGESADDVVAAIRDFFLPRLVEVRPANFGEAIAAAAELPTHDDAGRIVTAARAAVELALLDAYARAFDRSLESLAGWISETDLGAPGSRSTVRFGGVVSACDPAAAARSIRKMRLYRLCHFKLKVGDGNDQPRIDAVVRALGRGLPRGKTTLRLDANGAWGLEEAARRLTALEPLPIVCVEEPLARGHMDDWAALSTRTNVPMMADESLVIEADAEALIAHGAASWFNIRISKNGGLIPAMKLALLAARHHVDVQLGCMVGETSILSAAARWFLQQVPNVQFAEGNFGRFLLAEDVVSRPLRFGFGGRWKPLTGPGLGVRPETDRLRNLAAQTPMYLPL